MSTSSRPCAARRRPAGSQIVGSGWFSRAVAASVSVKRAAWAAVRASARRPSGAQREDRERRAAVRCGPVQERGRAAGTVGERPVVGPNSRFEEVHRREVEARVGQHLHQRGRVGHRQVFPPPPEPRGISSWREPRRVGAAGLGRSSSKGSAPSGRRRRTGAFSRVTAPNRITEYSPRPGTPRLRALFDLDQSRTRALADSPGGSAVARVNRR